MIHWAIAIAAMGFSVWAYYLSYSEVAILEKTDAIMIELAWRVAMNLAILTCAVALFRFILLVLGIEPRYIWE